MIQDIRYAFGQLVRAPQFTAVAVLTLAVGIAATASTFAVVKGLVLDPLPYPEPDRLVQVWTKRGDAWLDFMPLSTPDFLDLEEQLTSFDAFGTFSVRPFNIGGQHPEAVEGAWCTPGLFHAFNVKPLHGRWFTQADVTGDAAAVVILSHALWQQRFASNPDILGKTVRIDGREHTVVGVMPAHFELLSTWTRERSLSLWTPLVLRRGERGRDGYWMGSVARLKPGVSSAQADAELRAAATRINETTPNGNPRKTFWAMSLQRGLGGIPALRISVLLGAGWTLLVLAGQNVASMMLARGIARRGELSMRMALGAGRWRIARLVLTESLLLAAIAGGLGSLLTLWCLDALTALLPVQVVPRSGLVVDGWLLGCIVILLLFVVQISGLAPALLASKTDVVSGLKEGGLSHGSARKTQRRLRRLVIGQIAAAMLLVTVAIQVSHTYRDLIVTSGPLVSDDVLTAALAVKGSRYDDAARAVFWERFIEDVSALPGVRHAAVATKLPFDGGGVSTAILPDHQRFNPAEPLPFTDVSYVSPGFFPAIGASLLRGRYLARYDALQPGRHKAVVINRAMADRYWPGENPIGHRVRPAQDATPWSAEVVGVIEDLRQVAERPAQPEVYFPYADLPLPEAQLVVRSEPGTPVPLERIRGELRGMDPDLALAAPQTMQQRFDDGRHVITVVTTIVDVLTIAVLGLAALGLYGTLSFTFARRRRDIGVRLALGASPREIATLVLRQAFVWVTTGAAIGTAGSWLIARNLGAALEEASPVEPMHFGVSIAVVFATAALASSLPARRVTRVNPMDVLRAE